MEWSKTVTGISRASDVVTLTIGTADKIGSTDTVTVSYAQATGEEVTDSSNNLNKLANFGTDHCYEWIKSGYLSADVQCDSR